MYNELTKIVNFFLFTSFFWSYQIKFIKFIKIKFIKLHAKLSGLKQKTNLVF